MRAFVLTRWLFLLLLLQCPHAFAQSQPPAAAPSPALPQKKLLIGVYDKPPYVIKTEDNRWKGLSVDLWEGIARRLNWEYEYREAPPGDMVAQLKSGKLDIVIAEIPVEADMEKQIDFSQSFLTSSLGIVTTPPSENDWEQIVIGFFNWHVLIILTVICLGILLFGALIWVVEKKHNHDHFGGKKLHGFGSALWFSAVTMTTVGYGDKTPQTLVGRLIAFCWMMAGVLLIAAFTGVVAATVASAHFKQIITRPYDLRHLRNGVMAKGDAEHVLQKHGISCIEFPTQEAALQALLAGKLQTVVGDKDVLSYLLSHHGYTDRLRLLDIRFHVVNLAFAMPYNSPLRKPLNISMLEIIRSAEWQERLPFWIGSENSPEF